MADTKIRRLGRFSYVFSWGDEGLWYNFTQKGEKVTYWLNIGFTDFYEARIFKVIIGKFLFRLAWERK